MLNSFVMVALILRVYFLIINDFTDDSKVIDTHGVLTCFFC